MNRLSRNNLQEFCRTCLRSLKEIHQRWMTENRNKNKETKMGVEDGSVSINSYDLSLLPQLRKILCLLTPFDITREGDEDVYPRILCQICYEKMIEFEEFRKLAINSAEILHKIVNNLDNDDIRNIDGICNQEGYSNFLKDHSSIAPISERTYQGDEDDDDQLLLPELAPLAENPIKTEPTEIILPNDICDEDSATSFMKNELNLGYEEQDDSQFYSNSTSNTTYNSNSDETDDDEEQVLRKNSANALNLPLKNEPGMQKRDRNKKSLKCPQCGKVVYKQVYLDAHIRGVHEGHKKPFLCVECHKAFTRYEQLDMHIKTKHIKENRKFICGVNGCDAGFKLSKTMKTHRQVVHNMPFPNNLKETIELHQKQLNQEKELNPWICKFCFRNYSSKRTLQNHLRRHSDVRKYVCVECGVAKVTSRELKTHMRTHKPNLEKFKCSLCPQEFNHKNAISRHVRVVHEGQRRFPCSFCPRRFGTRNSQVCHERLHTGERPFVCKICDNSYPQNEGLKSHMKSHDKNLRKHVCSVCSQRFITKKNLNDHEKRHQSDKPHICKICSRGFYSVKDLDMHKKSHDLEELARVDIENSAYGGDDYGEQAMEAD